MTGPSQRALLEACFRAAVAGVDAARAVCREVGGEGGALVLAGERVPLAARLHVVAAGKAAAAMAAALEDAAGDRIAAGVAVTKDGHGLPLRRIELREAAHPVPDARSVEAARAALAVVAGAAPGDWIVGLLSGGASSLLACPLPGLSLDDVRGTTDALLACGAPIEEVNAVRKHLTAASGGRLAQAARAARVLVLALSDVIGDDASVIGSGPFAADPTTYADALRVLARRGARARIPRPALAHLEAGARGRREESAKPGDPALARVRQRVVASSRDAVEAACAFARSQGVDARALGAPVQGEAREVGRRLAALGLASAPRRAALLVAGGETTVTIAPGGPRGLGGRCQELVLAAALALEGTRVALLAAGTDGTDGPTDAAGAFADGGTVARGRLRGRDAARDLAAHDGYGFFSAEGGLLRTGPTRTHALDLALVYCAAFSAASASG